MERRFIYRDEECETRGITSRPFFSSSYLSASFCREIDSFSRSPAEAPKITLKKAMKSMNTCRARINELANITWFNHYEPHFHSRSPMCVACRHLTVICSE